MELILAEWRTDLCNRPAIAPIEMLGVGTVERSEIHIIQLTVGPIGIEHSVSLKLADSVISTNCFQKSQRVTNGGNYIAQLIYYMDRV